MMAFAREMGYNVDFIFIALDSPEMHVARVHDRVAKGGHDIPTELVLSRYEVSTLVRLGEGFDAADNVMILNSSGTSFRTLLKTESGDATFMADVLPEWVRQGLGARIQTLLDRDISRVIKGARIKIRDASRPAYLVSQGRLRGRVVELGACHIAMKLREDLSEIGLPPGIIAIIRTATPAAYNAMQNLSYDIDRRGPIVEQPPPEIGGPSVGLV